MENNPRGERFSLLSCILQHRRAYLFGLVMVLGATVTKVLSPFFVRFIVDALESGTLTLRLMGLYAAGYAVLSIGSALCSFFMRTSTVQAGRRIQDFLRKALFQRLTLQDASFFHRYTPGDLMNRMTSDLNAVSEYTGQGLLQAARTLAAFVISFTVMFAVNVRLTLILLVLLPATSAVFFVLLRLVGRRYEAMQEQVSNLTQFTRESFNGIRTIKGFCMEGVRHGLFVDENRELVRRAMKLYRVDRPIWPLMMFLFGLGVTVLMIVGGRQVVEGDISLGEFVQFTQYLFMLQWPMLALGWTTNIVQQGLTSWRRIKPLLEAEPAIQDSPAVQENSGTPDGSIRYEHVSLALGGRTLLHDLSISIPAGRTVGITGPTGSGKTLLVSLLTRLYDPSLGTVQIGGRDLRAFPLSQLRRHVAMAPQEPFLFSDTLAANILFEEAGQQADRLEKAAQLSQLYPDVQQFPKGFQTVLGEKGITLSGGQRQRTAISRALAAHPTILVLDDVFSAIDTRTEALILEQLLPHLHRQTTLLISHRVSTLRHADEILVLENGRVTQQGAHEQLVSQPGYYRNLFEIQQLEQRLEDTA